VDHLRDANGRPPPPPGTIYALIAANAIHHRLSLLASNPRQFERVPRLRLHAP
jgi:predicted nucleic acid-binding protein